MAALSGGAGIPRKRRVIDMRTALAVSSDEYFYTIGGGYAGYKLMDKLLPPVKETHKLPAEKKPGDNSPEGPK